MVDNCIIVWEALYDDTKYSTVWRHQRVDNCLGRQYTESITSLNALVFNLWDYSKFYLLQNEVNFHQKNFLVSLIYKKKGCPPSKRKLGCPPFTK
jgi:hypothetical protein